MSQLLSAQAKSWANHNDFHFAEKRLQYLTNLSYLVFKTEWLVATLDGRERMPNAKGSQQLENNTIIVEKGGNRRRRVINLE